MELDFEKMAGLIPAVVQDADTQEVLMLGFMNSTAVEATVGSGRVTFWSRSKRRLWVKGERSGHFLEVVEMKTDCDGDTLLVMVRPTGPACHTGTLTCFGEVRKGVGFLLKLEQLIGSRQKEQPSGSYTTFLFDKGLGQIVSKVREEAEEVAVAAEQETNERLIEESADLLFHLMVLLAEKEITLESVIKCLECRNQ